MVRNWEELLTPLRTLQRDLDKPQDWAITSFNRMKLKKGKCWIPHLGQSNPGCMDSLGNERLESGVTERHLLDNLNISSSSGPCNWAQLETEYLRVWWKRKMKVDLNKAEYYMLETWVFKMPSFWIFHCVW